MGRITARTPAGTRLCKALDADYRYRHGEMLRWMLSEALCLVGLPAWEPVPDDARDKVHAAIHVYEEEVAQAAPFEDVLGATYMALVSSWGQSALGQYFTPQPVARMMAEMTLQDLPPEEGRLITACDPSVGSGVMMLSLLQSVMDRYGRSALRRFSVTGIDLDPICARMFALQVLANSAIHKIDVGEVVVFRGNSLGDPAKLELVLHATAPEVSPVMPAKHPARLKAITNAAADQQLPLFDLPAQAA